MRRAATSSRPPSAARQRAAAPRDRRHAGHARRRHGDLRAGPELLPALPRRGLRAAASDLVRSTIAARRCACRRPTRPTCASSIAWPARMRIRISSRHGSWPAFTTASRASSSRRRSPPATPTSSPASRCRSSGAQAIERFARERFRARTTSAKSSCTCISTVKRAEAAGIQLAHHAARNRALSRTAVGHGR